MTARELTKWITSLIEEGKLYRFYKSKEWLRAKFKVMEEFHNECLRCKEQGAITRAETVHHVQYVKKHPALALSTHYTYRGKGS